MTDRERLVKLIKKSLMENIDKSCLLAENIADYILADGWIRPPCKVGDDIYRIGVNDKIYADWQVMCIQVYSDEVLYIDDSNNYFYETDIGKTVFLSREEAERAVRKEDDGE